MAAAVGGEEEKCLAPGGAVPVPGWEEQLWDVPREGEVREGPSCVAKAITIIIIIIKFLPALLSEEEGLLLFFPPPTGPRVKTQHWVELTSRERQPWAPPGAFIGGSSSLRAWGPR